MFTGIITDIGTITQITSQGNERRMWVRSSYDMQSIALGASIAHDGCCLTVTEIKGDVYAVDVSPHTLEFTTLGTWHEGREVNLERALKAGDELGGHMVSGHVDGVASIASITPEGQSVHYRITPPDALKIFIAEKGSVTLNGTSLTVTWVDDADFGLTLIPHTLRVTTWGNAKVGDAMNLEIDMLARYMQRMLEVKSR
jgi:riboflavin synthase